MAGSELIQRWPAAGDAADAGSGHRSRRARECGMSYRACRKDHEVTDGSPGVSVVVPADPPQITPQVAAALLTTLASVHAARATGKPLTVTAGEERAA
jgi:hypothetical protein